MKPDAPGANYGLIKLLLPLLEQLLLHCTNIARRMGGYRKIDCYLSKTLLRFTGPVEADEILLAEKDSKKLNRYCSSLIIRLFLEAVVKALFYCVKGKNFGVVILRIPYKMRYC